MEVVDSDNLVLRKATGATPMKMNVLLSRLEVVSLRPTFALLWWRPVP